ncbi:MAG: 4-hydroxythreonine-4-phosphate dehydrogenase PdxA [Verrucomicrobia bacterium]|nr:4-hydroxythreonine-4-phosphate dehydrogenase PdxA [Verrucomicrobiota bacterium]
MSVPIIAITMGDPAGIGPEIIIKALEHSSVYETCRPVVIGDASRLRSAGEIVGAKAQIRSIHKIIEAAFRYREIDCIDLQLVPQGTAFGRLSGVCGEAAFRFLEQAVSFANDRQVAAISTAPLNKEALHLAGHYYPGHTEILAELTGAPEVSLMLVSPKLKIIHVTAHVGLVAAIQKIDAGLVERTIARGRSMMPLDREPRIGVCGINPHAGENGIFGEGEEEEKIVPAVKACRARGWLVEGPLPADTLFYLAANGKFDLVVAMYHDQGHGPFKVLGIEDGVNVTAGLPVIRTSVDHGTAFDIAGTGKADERSMLAALRLAAQIVNEREAGAA